MLGQCLSELKEFLPVLYNCVEFLSLMDCLCSFAQYSAACKQSGSFTGPSHLSVRPRFGTQTAIRGGRHPILDNDNVALVPNDTVSRAPPRRASVSVHFR